MTSDRDAFLATITSYTNDQLIALVCMQYDRIRELEMHETENARINTEVHLEYRKVCEERDSLKDEVLKLKSALQKEIDKDKLLNRNVYGRSTEKFLDSLQGGTDSSFIDEDQEESREPHAGRVIDPAVLQEALAKNAAASDDQKTDSRDRKDKQDGGGKGSGRHHGKNRGQKDPLRESANELPQEIEYNYDPDELDRLYGKGNWRIAYWQETKTIEKLPVIYYQKVVYTPVISVGLEHCLESQPKPEQLLPHSPVSPSILADVCCRKYYLSLPTNRQAKDFERQGLMLSKQVMISWLNSLVPSVLGVVYEYLTSLLLKLKYTQNDETYIQVNKDGRAKGSKSFMWIHCTSELLDCPPIIIFCYEKTRGTDHLRKFFQEFSGYITCDAYIAYQIMEKEHPDEITVSGCMMHARRNFAIAFFVRDLDDMTDEEILELPEAKALLIIREIYKEEKKLKDLSADDRLAGRKKKVAPKADALFSLVHELADSGEVFPERLQEAITYAVNQEQRLRVFLTDGNIPIDDGHSERVIASYSVGRANWKFADTVRGAEVNAIMYSLTETAKANGADVEMYFRYLFEKLPSHLDADGKIDNPSILPEFTPWSDVYRSYEEMEKQRGLRNCRKMFPEPDKPKTPKKEKLSA